MKNNSSFSKRAFNFFISSFALAELISLIFFIFVKADFAFNMKIDPGITFSRFAIILLLSLIINLANLIFKLQKLNYAVKLILHSIIICLSFIVALNLINGNNSLSPATYFVLVLLFVAIYFIIFAIYAFIKKKAKKSSAQKTNTYTKQF